MQLMVIVYRHAYSVALWMLFGQSATLVQTATDTTRHLTRPPARPRVRHLYF